MSILKSYNVFVESLLGSTINLHEQAPSGGVIRVSLKNLLVPRSFTNTRKKLEDLSFVAGDTLAGAMTQEYLTANGEANNRPPVGIYTTADQIFEALTSKARTAIELVGGTLTQLSQYNFTVTMPTGKTFYLVNKSGDPWQVATNIWQGPLTNTIMQLSFQEVYLRVDITTNNLESKLLAGQLDATHDDLVHSDILGKVQLTRGEDAHSWRALIKGESSFDVHGSLQQLNLRLTDDVNTPIDGAEFSCVLGVEGIVLQDIPNLGHNPAPNPTNPKTNTLLEPFWK
jgi:hypothetical protein